MNDYDYDASLELMDRLPADYDHLEAAFPETGTIQPVGYTRFSTNRQKTTSTTRQRDKIIRYANGQPGWRRPIIYSDEAVSGTTISRTQLDAMFEACRPTPGTPIIVENMSRISRDGGAYQEFFRRRREVKAVTHLIGFGPMDELQESLFQTFAAYEYRNLIVTMRDGRSQAAEAGKLVTRLMFGLTTDAHGYIDFDPDWAPAIIRMFQLAAQGMAYTEIATYLTKHGMPGPDDDGAWSPRLIAHITRNPVFAGRRVHNPGVLDWEVPVGDAIKLIDLDSVGYTELGAE